MTQHNTQEGFLQISKMVTLCQRLELHSRPWKCQEMLWMHEKKGEIGGNVYHASQIWHLIKLRQ